MCSCLCSAEPTLLPALLPPPPPPAWSALWRSAEPRPSACPSWCRKMPRAGLGTETGDVMGHNLSSISKNRKHVQQRSSWCKHAAKISRTRKATTFLTGWADSFMLCMNEWLRLKPPRAVFIYKEIYSQTIRNKVVNRAFLDYHR